MPNTVTDFYRSYMCWAVEPNLNDTRKPGHMPWRNAVRILIDARCTIHDERNGTSEEVYLIAPCRTEWMYRETEVIQNPSGEYRVIFTQDRQLSVGKQIDEPAERGGAVPTSGFTSLEFKITEVPARHLADDAAVIEASQGLKPIIAKTEISNAERGLRAVLEYPIRTMNFNLDHTRIQVDTGPLVFPDFNLETEHLIDMCKLAHTVYNTLDYAEFVCKQPTPLIKNGEEVARVFHYSDYHQLPVSTTFFEADQ
jgi:hypothetical protein